MNYIKNLTAKDTFFLIPVVFFAGFLAVGILVFTYQNRDLKNLYVAGYLLPYIVSLLGSVKLTNSLSDKQPYRNFIIPFIIVTTMGTVVCILKLISSLTPFEWPLSLIADLLLTLSNILLVPAMTLLLYPFVKEREMPLYFSFWLLLFSLISAGVAFGIFFEDLLPLFDPEFVWSRFWDFSISNLIVGMLSGLYTIFGMPLVGLLSLSIIKHYFRNGPDTERGP